MLTHLSIDTSICSLFLSRTDDCRYIWCYVPKVEGVSQFVKNKYGHLSNADEALIFWRGSIAGSQIAISFFIRHLYGNRVLHRSDLLETPLPSFTEPRFAVCYRTDSGNDPEVLWISPVAAAILDNAEDPEVLEFLHEGERGKLLHATMGTVLELV